MRLAWWLCGVLAVCADPVRAEAPVWPHDGMGVDGAALVSHFQSRHFTPVQAWHYGRLLDLFAGPASVSPALRSTPTGQGWVACRQFGEGLRQRLDLSPEALARWEAAGRQGLVEQALQMQAAGKLSAFVAGCGMPVDELSRYLETGMVAGEQVPWSWQDLHATWPRAKASRIASLDALRRGLSLRWIRVSAWQLQTPAARRRLGQALREEEQALRTITRWEGPVLSLDGRVALDLASDAGEELQGELVYAPDVLVLRGNASELSHEWLHALDHALSPHPGSMWSAKPNSPLRELLATLRQPSTKFQRRIRQEEIDRTRRYLDQAAPSASLDPAHTGFSTEQAAVAAVKNAGARPRDALFLGSILWQLQTDPGGSWVHRREGVAATIVQGQSDGWISFQLGGKVSTGYVASPAELLASHFAGVVHACTTHPPAYPLQMPTCTEARAQRAPWQAFFARHPSPISWPRSH